MLEVVRAKFTQHEDLKAILLGSGDALLVEHTENDDYWGDGGDGSGKNRLGAHPHERPRRTAPASRNNVKVPVLVTHPLAGRTAPNAPGSLPVSATAA